MKHPYSQEFLEAISQYLPYRGPCAFCGGSDARHRILDAIQDLINAGEANQEIAEDLGLEIELINLVAQHEQAPIR